MSRTRVTLKQIQQKAAMVAQKFGIPQEKVFLIYLSHQEGIASDVTPVNLPDNVVVLHRKKLLNLYGYSLCRPQFFLSKRDSLRPPVQFTAESKQTHVCFQFIECHKAIALPAMAIVLWSGIITSVLD